MRRPAVILDIVIEPFRVLILGKSVFNPVWWCLRNIIAVSVVIYGLEYIFSIIKAGIKQKMLITFLIIILVEFIRQPLVATGIMGCLVYIILDEFFEGGEKKDINKYSVRYYLGCFAPIVLYGMGINNNVIRGFSFAVMVYCIGKGNLFQSL